jgi:hypothetical protein
MNAAEYPIVEDTALVVGRLEAQKDAIRDRFLCELAELRGYCGQLRSAMQFAHDHFGDVDARIRLRDALALPVPAPRHEEE